MRERAGRRPAGARRPDRCCRRSASASSATIVASFLDFSALEYISAQFDRLILLTYPFFVVLFGAVFFKRRRSPGR